MMTTIQQPPAQTAVTGRALAVTRHHGPACPTGAVPVIVFFDRYPHDKSTRVRLTAPAVAAILLTGIVALAVLHYSTLLGVPSGAVAAWALPASYAVVALIGAAWGLILKARRPRTYATIGLGTHAVTSQVTASGYGVRS